MCVVCGGVWCLTVVMCGGVWRAALAGEEVASHPQGLVHQVRATLVQKRLHEKRRSRFEPAGQHASRAAARCDQICGVKGKACTSEPREVSCPSTQPRGLNLGCTCQQQPPAVPRCSARAQSSRSQSRSQRVRSPPVPPAADGPWRHRPDDLVRKAWCEVDVKSRGVGIDGTRPRAVIGATWTAG